MGLSGYQSVTDNPDVRLAVIRDQFQHRTAVESGVSADRIVIFETYTEAAQSVREGAADAYASVGRAHAGFIEQNPEWDVELILVPNSEKPPAFGSFAFSLNDADLLNEVDAVLSQFLGTDAHRNLVASFGFSTSEVDMLAARYIEI